MTGHVIEFSPAGEVVAMYNDKFPLSFLGRQSIQRATEIKFNEIEQSWIICLPDRDRPDVFIPQPGALGFKTYEGARRVEVAWLNECRFRGCHPTDEFGERILCQLRKKLGM